MNKLHRLRNINPYFIKVGKLALLVLLQAVVLGIIVPALLNSTHVTSIFMGGIIALLDIELIILISLCLLILINHDEDNII